MADPCHKLWVLVSIAITNGAGVGARTVGKTNLTVRTKQANYEDMTARTYGILIRGQVLIRATLDMSKWLFLC